MRVHYHLSTPWGWKWKIKIHNLASFKNIKIFCENFIYNLSYIYNYKYLDINIYISIRIAVIRPRLTTAMRLIPCSAVKHRVTLSVSKEID